MAVYLVVDIQVKDAAVYEEYKKLVPPLVAKHGGEYLARGGRASVMEGDWQPTRLVLFKFPDEAAVRAFYADPDYAPVKALRHRAAATNAVMVEGVSAPVA